MGLLSNPSLTPRHKMFRNLAKHNAKISCVFYAAGLIWFVIIAHPDFNHGTYLSENALSPGLVYPEVQQDSSRLAHSLLEELRREHTEHQSTTPYAWIAAKMRQIGLETHVHHFTLRYPFAKDKVYHGKNIYGILRAPRIGSTEGIVFSTPYRPLSSLHTDITASVPTLLAFADFARRKNYWAKDLIFLVTDHEQLGMQAWLEAYFEGGLKNDSVLDSGNLPARAGALQAALNLEVQDFDIDYIDVKIAGLNGQLPNLDMFNLVQRITSREGISSGYNQTPRKKRRTTHSDMQENMRHMLEMLISQATGVPTGNHGLYHRYRIEALTLEVVKRHTIANNNRNVAALPLLKTIEGISRSLNNLLERFHQSYFFYILVQNDRFVSIGDFMPCLILLAAPLFIRASLLWVLLHESEEIVAGADAADAVAGDEPTSDCDSEGVACDADADAGECDGQHEQTLDKSLPYSFLTIFLVSAVGVGLCCNYIPYIERLRATLSPIEGNLEPFWFVLALAAFGFVMPSCFRIPECGLELLQIATLMLFGVALVVVGLLNFALGFIVAVGTVPLAILIDVNARGNVVRRGMSQMYALLSNPLIIVYVLVLLLTLQQFPELDVWPLLVRAYSGTRSAISITLMDSIIYGNWLHTIVSAVFLPLWLMLWTLAVVKPVGDKQKLKTN